MPLPLVERSQKEIIQRIRSRIEEVPAIKGIRDIEVRMTGKRLDITAHVLLDSTLEFEEVHRIVFEIELRNPQARPAICQNHSPNRTGRARTSQDGGARSSNCREGPRL